MAVAAGLLQSFNVAVFDIWLLVSCDLHLLRRRSMTHADRTGLRVLARGDARNGTGEEPHLNFGKVIFEWQKACRDRFRAKSADCWQIDDGRSAWRRSRVLAPPKSRGYGLVT